MSKVQIEEGDWAKFCYEMVMKVDGNDKHFCVDKKSMINQSLDKTNMIIWHGEIRQMKRCQSKVYKLLTLVYVV